MKNDAEKQEWDEKDTRIENIVQKLKHLSLILTELSSVLKVKNVQLDELNAKRAMIVVNLQKLDLGTENHTVDMQSQQLVEEAEALIAQDSLINLSVDV